MLTGVPARHRESPALGLPPILALTLALALLHSTPVFADGPVECPPLARNCDVRVSTPSTSGGSTPGSGSGRAKGGSDDGGDGGGQERKCLDAGVEVMCSLFGTDFYLGQGCWAVKADPQPPAGSPAWDGHDPGDGAVHQKMCPPLKGELIWLPDGADAPQVTPAQLAQQALDSMTLLGPDIGIAPEPGTTGVVGMPVWMWTEVSAETWGPNSATATVPGLSVTATAKAEKIVWTMGDGETVTCASAGTPYVKAYGRKKSPDCGHTYRTTSARQSGRKFTVTATTTWNVHWEGGGQEGDLTAVRDSQTTARIGEVQVVGD